MGFSRVGLQSKTSFRQKAVRKFYLSEMTDLDSAFWSCNDSVECFRYLVRKFNGILSRQFTKQNQFQTEKSQEFYFSKLTDLESAFWTCSNSSVWSQTQTGSLMGFSRVSSQTETNFKQGRLRKFYLSMLTDNDSVSSSCKDSVECFRYLVRKFNGILSRQFTKQNQCQAGKIQ